MHITLLTSTSHEGTRIAELVEDCGEVEALSTSKVATIDLTRPDVLVVPYDWANQNLDWIDRQRATVMTYTDRGQLETLGVGDVAKWPMIPVEANADYAENVVTAAYAQKSFPNARRFTRIAQRNRIRLEARNGQRFIATTTVNLSQQGIGLWARPGFSIELTSIEFDFEITNPSGSICGWANLCWGHDRQGLVGAAVQLLDHGHLTRFFQCLTGTKLVTG